MRRAALGLRRLSASPERRAVETMVVGEQTVPRAHAPPANLDVLNVALDQLRRAHPGAIFDRYLEHVPTVESDALVCAGAAVVGDVRIGVGASVWYNAVLRADLNYIELGAHSNLQDGTVVHLGNNDPTVIGDHVVVGHRAVLHGCTIEPHCLIGMQVITAVRARTHADEHAVCACMSCARSSTCGRISHASEPFSPRAGDSARWRSHRTRVDHRGRCNRERGRCGTAALARAGRAGQGESDAISTPPEDPHVRRAACT